MPNLKVLDRYTCANCARVHSLDSMWLITRTSTKHRGLAQKGDEQMDVNMDMLFKVAPPEHACEACVKMAALVAEQDA